VNELNFLEQLVSEWYSFLEFDVKTNVRYGKRPKGGFEKEMDVVAFDKKDGILFHIETSTDAEPWDARRERFRKKFEIPETYYKTLFPYQRIERIVVVGLARPRKTPDFGSGIKVLSVPEFMREIAGRLRQMNPLREAVPEKYPLLRAVQFGIRTGGCLGFVGFTGEPEQHQKADNPGKERIVQRPREAIEV